MLEAIQEKKLRPYLHLGVVAIEKGAFWAPSTTVSKFTYYYHYYYCYTGTLAQRLECSPMAQRL